MAMWESCTVTRAGAQLLMKMRSLEIYAAKYGTQTVDEDELKFQEDISEPGGIMSIVELKPYDWGFEIVIRMDNTKLSKEKVFFSPLLRTKQVTGSRLPKICRISIWNLQ